MAKKKPQPLSAADYDRINLLKIEEYVLLINKIYDSTISEFAEIAESIRKIDPKKIFTFDDFPAQFKRVQRILDNTTIKVVNAIDAGVDDAWIRSNIKNDALVNSVLENTKLSKKQVSKYFDRNLQALAETRTPAAQLSKKVYQINKQFVRVVEAGIDNGLGAGTGARRLATDIRKAVKDPEFAFRRVRNEKGALEWSKAAKKFKRENPEASGQGKYLNPQKNYERLTRTEINRSYRLADQRRYQDLDFVVGVRINLSNNPNHCPMCIALAGDYPKNFVFAGWHPQCRCYKTSILKTDDEIAADNIRLLEDKQPLKSSVNLVKKMPPNYNRWVEENRQRLEAAIKRDKKPYWIRDSYVDGDFSKGVNLK